jgi:H+/Cl- antiporter ClcA
VDSQRTPDRPTPERPGEALVDPRPREVRRTLTLGALIVIGAVVGAVVALIAFAIIDAVRSAHHSWWWWVSAPIAGAVVGALIVPQFKNARDDGSDAAIVGYRTRRRGRGEADAPLEGAQEADRTGRPVRG